MCVVLRMCSDLIYDLMGRLKITKTLPTKTLHNFNKRNTIHLGWVCLCDESVSRGRMTGTRGRGTGTQERRDEPSERRNGERETLWTRPNRVLGPGNEYPPCVDMAGTSDPLSRCVIIGD